MNAARFLINHQTLKHFFEDVEINGRHLARLNVAPEDVTRAIRICDEVIDTAVADSEFAWAREQLTFCTILALNNAYYEVREAEARAFYELLHIDVQSSNADVLYRRFVEAMAKSCGAAAGHVFVLSEDGRFWQLKASTAQAASAKTLAVHAGEGVCANCSLENPAGQQGGFDAGWRVGRSFSVASGRFPLPRAD